MENTQLIGDIDTDVSSIAFIDTCRKWIQFPEKIVKFLDGSEILSVEKNDNVETYKRLLLPRLKDKDPTMQETVVLDINSSSISFYPILDETLETLPIYYPKVAHFSIRLAHNCTKLEMWATPLPNESSQRTPLSESVHLIRVAKRLLRKMNAWSRNHMKPGGYEEKNLTDKVFSKEDYLSVYNDMKSKHKHWVNEWSAQTDAIKFVFEDIAIASYLICLWKMEAKLGEGPKTPSFIDVGCGNGFLVYLLSQEGYPGYGIDVHKRPLWDIFLDQGTDLRVDPINPTHHKFDKNVNWLLGNHSDELTPWIPILAHNTSPTCKFWVLPCCFYQFDGRFNQKTVLKSGEGRYRSYLDYVSDIGHSLGYNMLEDGMRIPSTKNICFVGNKRTFDSSNEKLVEEKTNFIYSTLLENAKEFSPRLAPKSSH